LSTKLIQKSTILIPVFFSKGPIIRDGGSIN